MKTSKAIQFVLMILITLQAPTLVWASKTSDYEEISYQDLLNELNTKKKKVSQRQSSDFDSVTLHAGIGYTNSFTQLVVKNENIVRHASGIQLSAGMDLFSPNWYSEGVFRNYGLTSYGQEQFTLRELDLKIGFKNSLSSIWTLSMSSGISNRFLRYSNTANGTDIDSTTPSLAIGAGLNGQVHNNVFLGAEIGAHSSLITRTADKSSLEFAIRVTTSL